MTTTTTQKNEAPRSFTRFLDLLADGAAAAQLAAKLFELGRRLREEAHNRDESVKGELTLKLKFLAQPSGSIGVDYEIRSKEPALRTAHGAMYLTDAGNFVPENPRQPLLPGVLREVKPLEAPREINEPQVAAPKEV